MKVKRFLFGCGAFVLIAIIAYSGYRLWDINRNYSAEAAFHSQLLQYKPKIQTLVAARVADNSAPVPHINQAVTDLQGKYSDAVGWLTIPNTGIDYPFAQSADNDYYLHRDLDGNYLAAGTIFMDYRCGKDFSGFNTIIFGHHMKNGSMFGTLQRFNNQAFFEANKTGVIFLADKTYEIDFMAFAVVNPNDAVIYDPAILSDEGKTAFLDYVKSVARYYRNVDVSADDKIVVLSTCNYEFQNARMVLIGKLIESKLDDGSHSQDNFIEKSRDKLLFYAGLFGQLLLITTGFLVNHRGSFSHLHKGAKRQS
ncbi:MAG: class B sortase [Firmicutes bacterium]|nr:class B sortase [Bacillota bacterium]